MHKGKYNTIFAFVISSLSFSTVGKDTDSQVMVDRIEADLKILKLQVVFKFLISSQLYCEPINFKSIV